MYFLYCLSVLRKETRKKLGIVGVSVEIRIGRAQLKRDGTRCRTVGEVTGKHASGVGSQHCTLPQNMVYPALLPLLPLMRTPRLPVVD